MEQHAHGTEKWMQGTAVAAQHSDSDTPPGDSNWPLAILEGGQLNSDIRIANRPVPVRSSKETE